MSDPTAGQPPPHPGDRLDPLAGATTTPPVVQEPAPAVPPAPAPQLADTPPPVALAPPPLPQDPPGERHGRFQSRKAATEVILHVDDQQYRCATTAPSDPLVNAVEAQESGDNVLLYQALRRLIVAVLYPADRIRYEARLAGQTDEGGPIGIEEVLAHGLWLIGVYFDRPTEGSAPSGLGPATQR